MNTNQVFIGDGTSSLLQSPNLTWDNISNTLSASNFVGSGAGLSSLNASNASTGTLTISRGGIGTTTLSANQVLIGNAATSILQSANLTWNNTTNTLSATNFVGAGSGITNLNYNNISTNKPIFTTPLKQDASNNVTIDLSAYPLKTYVDGWLNTINTTLSTKQNNLTFSNPLLNTSNTLILKINTAHFNIDSSGNLSLVTTSYLPLLGGSLTGDLTINKTNPNIQLTGTNGYNIAVPSSNGFFATDASANDMVIRSINKSLLLSGGGTSAITINTSNNVGIGTTNPGNILQVGDGARLRISNGITDYSLIGTKNVDDATNTRIVISGNTRTTFAGNIDYVSTSATGKHLFYNNGTETMRIDSSGNVGIGTNNPGTNKLNVNGYTNITGTLTTTNNVTCNGGILILNSADSSSGAKGVIFRSGYNVSSNNYNCSILTYDHDGQGFSDGLSINGWDGVSFCTGSNTRAERMRITGWGFVGIGNPTPLGTLSLGRPDAASDGTLVISKNSGGNRNFKIGYDGAYNMCFGDFGNATSGNNWRSTDLTIKYFDGNVGINVASARCKLEVAGAACINNGSPYAVTNNHMQSGSLTIGGNNANYGGGNSWSTNTAGLMMECLDVTEIMIHDAGARLASFMYYGGNRFYLGRDAGWGTADTQINGTLDCQRYAIARNFENVGEIVNYTVNYNGGTNSGFFWTINGYWGNTQASYLTLCIYPTGIANVVWYGRAFLSRTGGFYNVICDYRNPDGGYNTIVVQDFWGANGANALKIDLFSNFVYASSFVVKAMG